MRICETCGRYGDTVQFISTHGCGDPRHTHEHDLCVECWLWASGIAGGEPPEAERGATAGHPSAGPAPFHLP